MALISFYQSHDVFVLDLIFLIHLYKVAQLSAAEITRLKKCETSTGDEIARLQLQQAKAVAECAELVSKLCHEETMQ